MEVEWEHENDFRQYESCQKVLNVAYQGELCYFMKLTKSICCARRDDRANQYGAPCPNISDSKDSRKQWRQQVELHFDFKRPCYKIYGARLAVNEIVNVGYAGSQMRN